MIRVEDRSRICSSRPGFSRYNSQLAVVQVLRHMVRGLIKKEIAEQMAISYHTVNNHEVNIFRKLKIHTRSAAVAKALMEKIC
jgi:DNA-binding NarL/FixJ family response regulator